MGVRVREKPIGSGVFWVFVNHQGKRKSKKIGRDEGLANEVAKKIEAELIKINRAHVHDTQLIIYKRGLSKSTVSTARNVISGTLEYAVEGELVKNNHALGILKKLGLDDRNERDPVQPMTTEEVMSFLKICKKYRRN